MGTYEIKSIIERSDKFAGKVSFNGKPEEYYEAESLDKDKINETLQTAADNAQVANQEQVVEFSIENGKLE